MIEITGPLVSGLRRMTRQLGINALVGSLLNKGPYEKIISDTMQASIARGDCVWDVGANVGYYSTRFSSIIGESGKVFAFEPSELNRAKLNEAVASLPNVIVIAAGLSSTSGKAAFVQGEDDLGATSRVLTGDREQAEGTTVELLRGDEAVRFGIAAKPNVIKIDVEGFELEVLLGLGDLVRENTLREIFIEVHFGLLDERGMSNAPAQIQKLLKSAGFTVAWLDASHIQASR